MEQLTPFVTGILSLLIGAVLGYYARQSIAKRDWKTIEAKIQKRIEKARKEAHNILSRAKEKALFDLEEIKKEEGSRRKAIFKAEQLSLKRENGLGQKISDFETKEKDFREKVTKVKQIKQALEKLQFDQR